MPPLDGIFGEPHGRDVPGGNDIGEHRARPDRGDPAQLSVLRRLTMYGTHHGGKEMKMMEITYTRRQ
jgi:hypothetical protein